MIGFSVDQEEVIITMTVRMSIKEFLLRVTEVYTYATKYLSYRTDIHQQELLSDDS